MVRSSVELVGSGGEQADLTVSDSYRGPLVTVFDLYEILHNFKLMDLNQPGNDSDHHIKKGNIDVMYVLCHVYIM